MPRLRQPRTISAVTRVIRTATRARARSAHSSRRELALAAPPAPTFHPRLPQAKGGQGFQEAAEGAHNTRNPGIRPRSRSPRATSWTGDSGRHMKPLQAISANLLGSLRDRQKHQTLINAQPKQQARKRQAEEGLAKEGPSVIWSAKSPKCQESAKVQEPQPTSSQVAERRKASEKEGFSHVFKKRPLEPQEADRGASHLKGLTKDISAERKARPRARHPAPRQVAHQFRDFKQVCGPRGSGASVRYYQQDRASPGGKSQGLMVPGISEHRSRQQEATVAGQQTPEDGQPPGRKWQAQKEPN
eukprot:16430798-Heterocapsa_arctica.AAC.1